MLIVYCCRGMSFAQLSGWLPGLIAGLAVAALHVWKKNDMLSILGGTVLYMGVLGWYADVIRTNEECL